MWTSTTTTKVCKDSITGSARYETATWNDDELPMVSTYRHYPSALQHMISRERKSDTRNDDNQNNHNHHDNHNHQNKPTNPTSTNPYMAEFLDSSLCRDLQTQDVFRSWSQKRTLKKEVIEAMAATNQIKKQLKALHIRASNTNTTTTLETSGGGNDGSNLVVFDLCAGKGLLSVVLTKEYPKAKIHMVDNDPRMVLTHLQATPNISFHLLDTHSDALERLIQDCSGVRYTMKNNYGGDGDDNDVSNTDDSGVDDDDGGGGDNGQEDATVVVLVGIHLCGSLSYRAIQLYRKLVHNGQRSSLVLCPCCLPRTKKRSQVFGHKVRTTARSLRIPPYQLWCTQLYLELQNATTKTATSTASGDNGRQQTSNMMPDTEMGNDVEHATFLMASNCPLSPPHDAR